MKPIVRTARTSSTRLFALVSLLMLSGIVVACGGSSSTPTTGTANSPTATSATPTQAAASPASATTRSAAASPAAPISSPAVTPASTPTLAATPQPAAKEITVKIVDFAFDPPTITVAPGTTVTWVNDGATIHTATSKTGIWDSKVLNPGEQFRYTFTTPGDFAYWCAVHPDMLGEVIVK